MNIKPDPEYDYIPPLVKRDDRQWPVKKGTQCGECGMKFEYGHAYGFCCMNTNCPTRWGRY